MSVEAAISGTTEELKVWLSGEDLDAMDVLTVESAEAKELTDSVAAEKIVGVYSLSLKSGKVDLKNDYLNFYLGTQYAGQVFTLVYYLNGERMEIDGTVGQNGVLSFPLKQVTVIMLVQK